METGLQISETDFFKSGSFAYDIPMPERKAIASRVVYQYKANILTDGSEVVVGIHDDDKHSGFEWVTDEELEEFQEQGKLLGNTKIF